MVAKPGFSKTLKTTGADRDEPGPQRTCIVTRQVASPETMIRFVVGPDDVVIPDLRRKLPGRGVWVTASRATVALAARKGAFSRGFKAKVQVGPSLDAEVDLLLATDALQSLAMANKAGRVVTGFAKVEAQIAVGQVAALVHASDGALDGTRKLDGAWMRQRADAGDAAAPLSIKLFSAEQLDLALGRVNVIHAALAPGPASQAFLFRCRRLTLYRSTATQDHQVGAVEASAPSGVAGPEPGFRR